RCCPSRSSGRVCRPRRCDFRLLGQGPARRGCPLGIRAPTSQPVNLTLAWLYPDSMSIYGDRGNVIALTKRAEWRGIELDVWRLPKGERMDRLPDLAMFGG